MPKDTYELKQLFNKRALDLLREKVLGSQFHMTQNPKEISAYLCPISLMISIEGSSLPSTQELLSGRVTSIRVYESDSKLYIDFNIDLPKIGDILLCDKIRVSEEMIALIFNPQTDGIYSYSFTLTLHVPIVIYA